MGSVQAIDEATSFADARVDEDAEVAVAEEGEDLASAWRLRMEMGQLHASERQRRDLDLGHARRVEGAWPADGGVPGGQPPVTL